MYKLTKPHNTITRINDGANIPSDPDNTDYAAYLAWVAAGNTPEPRPLQEVRDEKLTELRALRDAACSANVTAQGKTFTAEPKVQTGFKRLADRMRRGKPSKLSAILDANGKPVTVNIALLDAIEDAIADNTESAWEKYGQLVQQVKAANTVDQVNAIVW